MNSLVLDEIENAIEIVGWAVKGSALRISFSNVQLFEAKFQGVTLDRGSQNVTPSHGLLSKVSGPPVSEPLNAAHIDVGHSKCGICAQLAVRTNDVDSGFVQQVSTEGVRPIYVRERGM